MAVVAYVNAEFQIRRFENRVTRVTRLEEKFLVEPGIDLRNMSLAVLAEELSVRVNYSRSIVVNTGHVLFVNRHDDDHVVLLRILLHQLRCVAIGNFLGGGIPLGVLAGAKIGLCKNFLETQNLYALFAGIFDVWNVSFEHTVPNLVGLHRAVAFERHLNQTALNFRHADFPQICFFSRCYRHFFYTTGYAF